MGKAVDAAPKKAVAKATPAAKKKATCKTTVTQTTLKRPAASSTKGPQPSVKTTVTPVKTALKRPAASSTKDPQPPVDNFKFPGTPTERTGSRCLNGSRIYTDLTKQAWRVVGPLGPSDRAFNWTKDAKAAWKSMLEHVNSS